MLINPRFINAENTFVDAEIETEKYGTITTTIDISQPSTEPHVIEMQAYLTENIELISAYIPPPLESFKSTAKAQMDAAARSAILAGFTSDALGSNHTYGGKETDQINLVGAAASGADMPFPCADSNGVWERRIHTAAQLQTALAHGSEYKQAVLTALDARRAEIEAASDLAEIENVTWSDV